MLIHLLFVDDEEEVLESMIPGFLSDLGKRLATDASVQRANDESGSPLPKGGRINVKLSTHNYQSRKAAQYVFHSPAHIHLHLCCEKGGSFRHALRLLKDHFFAVVVSDLRFSEDTVGSRAGRFFIEDVRRRNPETFGVLYSAYQKPEGFPAENFVRKGAGGASAGDELLKRIVEGVAFHLSQPGIRRLNQEVRKRGLVFQSDAFGSTLRRLYDYAGWHFGDDVLESGDRRRPRPTLLIDGETGVGKTELAHLLHQLSERRHAPFQSASCSQLTNENLLRSTLFGHVKGAFSGATSDRPGLVAAAGKGLLLLDDLHTIDDECSVILHSFLDDGEFSHLGEDEKRRQAQNALVATVETPRWSEIKVERKLAESFINRVEQLVVRIPPLRERPEDIVVQADAYCSAFAKQLGVEMELSPGAKEMLVEFGFPSGNSRKLRDFLKGLVSENAKSTDYLDVLEVQEHSATIGFAVASSAGNGVTRRSANTGLPISDPASTPGTAASSPAFNNVATGTSASTQPVSAILAWPTPDGDPNNWPARIGRLAIKAAIDELGLSEEAAELAVRSLFCEKFPPLWQSIKSLTGSADGDKVLEIKAFDELLRYFVVFQAGTPAKAARDLGMKDNALREFIYSREQRRLPE